ncbi:MAG: hypothetical protein ACREC0_01675, partial [Methylocella sp.]
ERSNLFPSLPLDCFGAKFPAMTAPPRVAIPEIWYKLWQPATAQQKTPARGRSRRGFSLLDRAELWLVAGGVAVPADRRLPGAIATGKHPGEIHHRVGAAAAARR